MSHLRARCCCPNQDKSPKRSISAYCTVGMGRATQAGAFATCFAITNPNGLVDFAFI